MWGGQEPGEKHSQGIKQAREEQALTTVKMLGENSIVEAATENYRNSRAPGTCGKGTWRMNVLESGCGIG